MIIKSEIETLYDKGDIVAFKSADFIIIGMVVGMNVDYDADRSVWYNIQCSKEIVLSYGNGGDVAEWDILFKINDENQIERFKEFLKGED